MPPRKKRPGSKKSEVAKQPSAVMETRVFKSGNSYAVRLPKLLYTEGEGAVYMKKLDNGKLLIMPKRKKRWPAGFFESFGTSPIDFEAPARPRADLARDKRDASLFGDDE